MSKGRIFIVWNSEIIGFDFTDKSLYFIEKNKNLYRDIRQLNKSCAYS